jgi:hypothetical protein
MPVLPNPDPQVWRMLLGDRAEEILGRAEENRRDAPHSDASLHHPPAAGSGEKVTGKKTRRKRNAGEI